MLEKHVYVFFNFYYTCFWLVSAFKLYSAKSPISLDVRAVVRGERLNQLRRVDAHSSVYIAVNNGQLIKSGFVAVTAVTVDL